MFPDVEANFLPEGMFDHSPMILKGYRRTNSKKPFSNVEAEDVKTYAVILQKQAILHQLPGDSIAATKEEQAAEEYRIAHQVYLSFLQQTAKLQWLEKGDENTKLFHQSIKHKRQQNSIHSIHDTNGNWTDTPDGVKRAFTQFYSALFCNKMHQRTHVNSLIMDRGPRLTDAHRSMLVCNFTLEEIKSALWSIPDHKAPGMDGYNSHFFKSAWHIIKNDLHNAINDFSTTCKILKEINVTSITLIPKISVPASVSDFRPIACCNVIYKCITKLICSRLSKVLPAIVSPNQGAFVTGRSILHNVLICQDLIKMYNHSQTSPCCLMKVDIRKAYDTVEWGFIEEVMLELGFPPFFVQLIMTCLSTTRSMKAVGKCPQFRFHTRCRTLQLNHLCFADDLLMFCKGELHSVALLLEGFKVFSDTTGLQANPSKSSVYCCGIEEHTKLNIGTISGFTFGTLPFRYLGVPISTRNLQAGECDLVVDKMVSRIKIWSSRHLSFAGRTQLVNSVLMSISVYWGKIFLLPKSVIKKINAVCRAYLWFGTYDDSRPGPVSWNNLYGSKTQGGLGFRNLAWWNQAAVGKLQKDWLVYRPSVAASWAIKYICKVKQDCSNRLHSTRWLTDQKYSIGVIYQQLCDMAPKVNWHSYVWNRFTLPKHIITLWLALQDRLKTRDRLHTYGVINDDQCALCGLSTETCTHLFFSCHYSKECCSLVLQWLGFHNSRSHLSVLLKWLHKYCKNPFKRRVAYAAVASIVYQIWRARNLAIWEQTIPSIANTVKCIQYTVKHRILSILS
ncbi:uncharacterized protein [Spinacia oleracea]|uniref:Reverse transcriptase domain-containing protein n=1 Tax=Spinacia oleracea TaxID=3562 RepID=A0A9R0HSK5_SPIOL|nr:uncharacterized protein LOC110775930 [Spinacia oleracea]